MGNAKRIRPDRSAALGALRHGTTAIRTRVAADMQTTEVAW
ncbi:hypothetical protein [Nocardioides carbamazepini]|nr:hypothetical protein [Nocardioides carbamazepini]